MTSSMMTGEQRWASKRRGGMTVLGKVAKVAAPKPLNLPSQRLENHGLDRNVEIVPKGTLSWGSRPSSSGSNAWATSALSPSTDGGSSSPRHMGERPLSGGGTRPSTADGDKAYDSSAWGTNSRPSSASGIMGANHASLTSLRPHSADTRPGSSQLSRFAEHSSDSSRPSGALGASETSEQTGVNEGFSLSSGDFPTLGTEIEESKRSLEALDASHGRPASSSGGVKSMSDSMEIPHDDARNSDNKGRPWREDCPPFTEGGPRPNMERWHGDPHLYQNTNFGSPHYDSWHGSSVNPPGGLWYRGPPGPPPYGGPIPTGGFHMDPFPYHPPQAQPGLAKNGDMYRPHLPESFMRPGMPMRPEFYPPHVPYEGYHRPLMGFHNPNERDLPFMGRPPGPIYNRPTIDQVDPRLREGRWPDQVDPNHLHDPRQNWGHRMTTDGSNHEKGILSKTTLQENAWRNDFKKHESRGYGQNAPKDALSFRPPANSKVSASVSNVEKLGTGSVTDDLASPREHSLIQKIEGLNGKSRASSGSQDAFHRVHSTERVQSVNVWAQQSVNEADSEVIFERHHPTGVLVPVSRDANLIASEKNGESNITGGPRRAGHEAPNRGDHHGEGDFVGQETSRWGRKSQSHSVHSTGSNDQVEVNNSALQPNGVRRANIEMKGDGESSMSGLDPNDSQRAKMREIARQRAIQLQKEEEERIREQKAKALAKLEELNRRSATQVVEIPSQKEIVQPFSSVPDLVGQETSTWGKESQSHSVRSTNLNLITNDQAEANNSAWQSTGVCKANIEMKGDDKSSMSGLDPNDTQLAKMREIARQRAIQLQKEEKERIREQKAKSLVKLEELYRDSTTQIVEVPSQKEIVPPYSSAPLQPDDSRDPPDLEASSKVGPRSGFSKEIAQMNEKGFSNKNLQQDSLSSLSQSSAVNIDFEDADGNKNAAQALNVSKHKRVGYKPRQNVPLEKNQPQKSIAGGAMDSFEDYKSKNVPSEITFGSIVVVVAGKELPGTTLVSDSPSPLNRRNNKSVKNKHKLVDSSNAVSLPNNSDLNLGQDNSASLSPKLPANAKEQSQLPGNHSSLSREDDRGRENNSWKAQHSRKPKSSQGNRLSEKAQSNDFAVWAPVRSHNKVEVPNQTTQKAAEHLISSSLGESSPQNSPKTRRAELERYIPKPAKELAQQGSIQQPQSLSDNQVGGREKVSEFSDSIVKAGPVGEGKNRHVRGQGSWRQRVSGESNLVHASQGSSVRSKESMITESQNKPDVLSTKGPDAILSDGWNHVSDSSSNSYATSTGMNDQFISGKGSRHAFKGKKANHQSFEHKDSNASSHDSQYAPKINHTEKTQSSKEKRAASDRSASHWQPKSQGYVAHSQQGKLSHGSQSHIADVMKGLKPDIGSGSGPRSGYDDKTMFESHESNQEKRGPHVKGLTYIASQEIEADIVPASTEASDRRNEQRPSSGYRKNSYNGGRANRVYESRGDRSTMALESKQNYSSDNRERQQKSSHYEYQNNSNDSEPQIENQREGPRFRERGHSRRGRGNFGGMRIGNDSNE